MDALFAFQQQCIDNHNVCKVLRMTCGRNHNPHVLRT